MEAFVRMTFATKSGSDLVLTIPGCNENLTTNMLNTSMTSIVSADAIAGNHGGLVGVKEGVLCKVTKVTYDVAPAA